MYLLVSVQRKVLLFDWRRACSPENFQHSQPFRVSTSDELEKREGAGTLFVQPIITRCFSTCSTSCWPEKTLFSIVLEALHHGQRESGRNRSICWPERTAEWTFSWISECKWQKGCSTLHPGQDKNRIANQLRTGSSSSRVADRIVVSSWTRNRWLSGNWN